MNHVDELHPAAVWPMEIQDTLDLVPIFPAPTEDASIGLGDGGFRNLVIPTSHDFHRVGKMSKLNGTEYSEAANRLISNS